MNLRGPPELQGTVSELPKPQSRTFSVGYSYRYRSLIEGLYAL